jgi:hypothetical protein
LPELDIYLHVRVLMGMIVGLALTHLLRNAGAYRRAPQARPNLLGASGLGVLDVSVFTALLVVGIPAGSDAALELQSISVRSDLCAAAVPVAMRVDLSGTYRRL